MEIAVRVEWDMGHRLPNHGGLCKNLHGHRYVAEIYVFGMPRTEEGAADEGMVEDFGTVKAAVRAELEKLDHRFLVCERDDYVAVLRGMPGVVVVPFVPTAENISASLLRSLRRADIAVTRIRLYETPTSWADAGLRDIV